MTEETRRAILTMEIAGLLHDIGKLSEGFVNYQQEKANGSGPRFYQYKLIVNPKDLIGIEQSVNSIKSIIHSIEQSQERPLPGNHPLNHLKKKLEFCQQDPLPDSGAPFLESTIQGVLQHLSSHEFKINNESYRLSEAILFCEQWMTEIEDHIQTIFGKSMLPSLLLGRIHGVAHYEKPGASMQPRDIRFRCSPFGLEEKLPNLDEVCKQLPFNEISGAIQSFSQRSSWLEKMKISLSLAYADTSIPLNEITLWDWGSMVATLTKAAISASLRDFKPIPIQKENLSWQTLAINTDRAAIYERAEKISDLLGLKRELDAAEKTARELVEFDWALGNAFYHDETGLYFLVSGFDHLDETLIRDIQRCYPPDLRPLVNLGQAVPASDLDPHQNDPEKAATRRKAARRLLAEPRQNAIQALKYPVKSTQYPYDWGQKWSDCGDREICPVCGLRPLGGEPDHIKNDAKWVTKAKAEDRHICQECLFRRGRQAQEWTKVENRGTTIWLDEVADHNGRLALLVGRFNAEGWLDGRLLETLHLQGNETKYPTPAAIVRVLRAMREFWENDAERAVRQAAGLRQGRLLLTAADNASLASGLGDYPHSYELRCGSRQAAVAWTGKNEQRLLVVENMEYLANRWGVTADKLETIFRENEWDLVEERTSLSGTSQKTIRQQLKFSEVKLDQQKDRYSPVITLLQEPTQYLALLPAASALRATDEIWQEYVRQFCKVRDKLPLALGLVFFHRRIPIRAVLAAGRSLLSRPSSWQDYHIKTIESTNKEITDSNNHSITITERVVLEFSDGIRWEIPTIMGDGATEDKWYPCMLLEDPFKRKGDMVKTVLAQHIRAKDAIIWARPSLFDYEFLDTSGRRHDIAYTSEGRRCALPRRPYRLEELEKMEALWSAMACLAENQLNDILQVIEERRASWLPDAKEAVFKQFVRDCLAQAAWPKGKYPPEKELEDLTAAGVSGLLLDTLELHLKILKEKTDH